MARSARTRWSILLVLTAFAAASSAQIVRDGDFEAATGNQGTLTTFGSGQSFDGFWTVTLLQSGGIVGIDTDDGFQISGHKSVLVFHGNIAQNLVTTANQRYNIAFDAYCGSGNVPSFVDFGGTRLSVTIPTTTTHFVLQATATSASTPLVFTSSMDNAIELDNVSVTPVPEPVSLLALGLPALALLRRRRRA